MTKIVVMFPESQILDSKEGFFENCELINSDLGIKEYGACAYLVDKDWYEKVTKGEVKTKSYSQKDFETKLKINWSYPIS